MTSPSLDSVKEWKTEQGSVQLFLKDQQVEFHHILVQESRRIPTQKIEGLREIWNGIANAAKRNNLSEVSVIFDKYHPKFNEDGSLKFVKDCFEGMQIQVHLMPRMQVIKIDDYEMSFEPEEGEEIILHVDPNLSVRDLKLEISKRVSAYRKESIVFRYKEVILQDDNTLLDYEILHQTRILECKPENEVADENKTCSFEFNSLMHGIQRPTVRSGPKYWRVDPGLNLIGKCKETGCPAEGKRVWVKVGMGKEFNIPKLARNSMCPMGNHKVEEVHNMGFLKCTYSIEGVKESGEEFKENELMTTPGHVATFVEGDNCKWEYLEVTTEPIIISKEAKKDTRVV